MSIYALIPLIAIIVYIPLLATTVSTRPWQRRHTLFILFLIPAMMWSLFDYLSRSNLLPEYNLLLFRGVMLSFSLMCVQFHVFNSSFFPPRRGRWLLFAYASLALIAVFTFTGHFPEEIITEGDKHYPIYGPGIILLAGALVTLAARDFYVLGKRLKNLTDPVLYNQIFTLLLGLGVLLFFTISALLPWGREWPLGHVGNIINAFILSYAVVRHQLVDIRIVMRQGTALVSLGLIGALCYWLLLVFLHGLFDFNLDLRAAVFATIVAMIVGVIIYRMRGFFFATMSRAFQGESYNYRWRLSDFAGKIHSVFSLKKQGGELLELLTKALGIERAGLLFPEIRGSDYAAQIIEPRGKENPLYRMKVRQGNPVLNYLKSEQKPLMREDLSIKPEFLSLWEKEREEFKTAEIELILPLISRDRLIAVLVLGKKRAGRYSLEDIRLLESVTNQVAVSMEKEYLSEELREREEELSVLNRTSAIITSSLDIQGTFAGFIEELKTTVDVNWAAIFLAEENSLYSLAVAPAAEAPWKKKERVPIKGSITERAIEQGKAVVEQDLAQDSDYALGKFLVKQGVRSLICLPLTAKGEAIGSLVVASKKPDAYGERHVMLMEQVALQIAMHVENVRLYAKVEEKSRIDELTGLSNRRSLDEFMASETGRHSRYGGVFSLIILDLDNFKAFNDNHGHPAGDKLLRQIGSILKSAIRSADQAFRYGGDEFAVLLPQTAIDAASQVAQRIRRQIALRGKTELLTITASLGLANWPADGITPNDIIAAADAALYEAKRNGGNRSHCASGTLMSLEEVPGISHGRPAEDDGILSTIYALAATVDARNPSTIDHSKKVSEYALALAAALKLQQKHRNRLEISALLHDIGKLGISDDILNKAEKLNDEEWEIVRKHPELGASIAGRAPQLRPCVEGIKHHHEHWDGSGYPGGLKSEEIPLDARILAIADAYASMTAARPYADALSTEAAITELERHAGTQFDPELTDVFVSSIKKRALSVSKG